MRKLSYTLALCTALIVGSTVTGCELIVAVDRSKIPACEDPRDCPPEPARCEHVPCREDIPAGSCPAGWGAYTVNTCTSDVPAPGCVLSPVSNWQCTYGDSAGETMVHVQCCCEIDDCAS